MNPSIYNPSSEIILTLVLTLSISLGIYSAFRPMAIIPSYFLLISLFFEGGNLANILGFQFGPSFIFIAMTSSVLIWRRWRQWRMQNYFKVKHNDNFKRKSPFYFLILFIISILLPVSWHFAVHGIVMWDFLKIHAFALWAVIIFIIAPEEIDFKNFRTHCTIFGLILLAVYAPQSLMLYELSDGLGLGRLRHFDQMHRNDQYWADIGLIQISHKNLWFQMNLMGSFAFIILLSGISSYFFEHLYQNVYSKKLLALGIIFIFYLYLIFINQYFLLLTASIAIVLISVIVAFFYRKNSPVAIWNFYVYSFLIIVTVVISCYLIIFQDIKKVDKFSYASQLEFNSQSTGNNRLTIIIHGLRSFVTECFWKGCSHESSRLTSHSDILDRFINFGILFGLISNFIIFYFLWWLSKKKVRERLSYGEYVFTLNMLITISLCSLGGIFSSLQSSLALMIATGILWLRALDNA